MRHILQRDQSLRKGNEHPAYTPHGAWHSFALLRLLRSQYRRLVNSFLVPTDDVIKIL